MKRLLVIVGLLFLLAPARAEAATQHVAMENYAFGPAGLTVRVGDTVTWTNHDQAPHNAVTTSGPAAFSSPLLNQGQSWSFTFTVPGTYAYYCSVHPDMRAQIVVLPAETQAAPPPPKTAAPAPVPVPTSEAAAPPPAQPTPTAPPTTTSVPAQQTTQTAQAAMTESLDPMLLVAGLVAGVVILCLLLTSAKPE